MKCWDCDGTGILQMLAFEKKKVAGIEIECERCDGSGKVPQDMERWVERGKKLKEKRIGMRINLHKFAEQLQCLPIDLSKAERGIVDPREMENKLEDWMYNQLTTA